MAKTFATDSSNLELLAAFADMFSYTTDNMATKSDHSDWKKEINEEKAWTQDMAAPAGFAVAEFSG